MNPRVISKSTGRRCIRIWWASWRTPRDRRRGLLLGRLIGRGFLSNFWYVRFVDPDQSMLGKCPPGDVVGGLHHELGCAVRQGKLLRTHRPQLVKATRFREIEVLEIGLPE